MSFVADPETGHFLSQDHLRIAEIIYDYNPNLELVWIPPENRKENDTELPFAVRFNPTGEPGGPGSYIVFQLKEDEVDHRVLQRLFEADNSKTDVLGALESKEAALRLIEMKKAMDEAAERKEFTQAVLKSPKSVYRHGGVEYRE